MVNGEVFDVAVDLREGSETFGKWFGIVLSAENKNSFLYQRILHMDSSCCLIMQSSAIRLQISIIQTMRADCSGLSPEIGVEWPMPEGMTVEDLTFSEKDTKWSGIKEYKK